MKLARIRYGLLALLLLSGCGYRVAITYLKPRQSSLKANALSNVYMIVEIPGMRDLPSGLDIDRLANKVAAALHERGGRLCLYSTGIEGNYNFAPIIQPSSYLYITLSDPSIREEEGTETQTQQIDDKVVKNDVHYWTATGSMRVSAHFVDYPSNADLGTSAHTLESSKNYDSAGGDNLRSRLADQSEGLIDATAKWVAKSVIPVILVTRQRKLYTAKDDKESARAARAASMQRWAEAVPVWNSRVAQNPHSWRETWNLAVWAETANNFDVARMDYQKAKEYSAGDKDAPTAAEWAEIDSDLKDHMSASAAEPDCAAGWFRQRVAVLPFSDVSTSIDGPIHVRKLTREALAHAGYNVMAIDEVDRILRENGFTQGGQLGATNPAQLSSWLKADLLLYGHLDQFDEVTLGIIGGQRITGSCKLWSAAKKDYLWVSNKTVEHGKFTNVRSGGEAAWAFLSQLASSWVDKASRKPMAETSAQYVHEQISELPQRPH